MIALPSTAKLTAKLIASGAALVAILGGLWYLSHVRYQAGKDDCVAAHQAAALKAAKEYQAEVGRQQSVIAELNERLEAERQRKNQIITIYREAVKNDPDCAAWSSEFVRCPLRLRDDPDNSNPTAPPDPSGTTGELPPSRAGDCDQWRSSGGVPGLQSVCRELG